MTLNIDQIQQAKKFLEFHHSSTILILANAWDVASAKIFELEGFQAIGTTSAGIASTLGYPDGQHVGIEDTSRVIHHIIQKVNVPVSADIEAGYANSTEGVVRSAKTVLKAGAVGINLEDGTGNISRPLFDKTIMTDRIKAIRKMADEEGIHFFINARTDVFLTSKQKSNNKINQAIERANTYRQAGADGIFVPDFGDIDKDIIRYLVNEIDAPLNIIAGEGKPSIAELENLGVSRVSLGPKPMRACLAFLKKIAGELKKSGTYQSLLTDTITYEEVNSWFQINR